jgi:uncharacterized protein YndB with AHSA1/START domain
MRPVARSRVIAVPSEEIWSLIADPYDLPRWWPRAARVEAVREGSEGRAPSWTLVLETRRGSIVRADYHCVSARQGAGCVWEQDLEGTPFEGLLRSNRVSIGLAPAAGGTEVTISSEQALRGLSRLGGPMARRAASRTLQEALAGIERALTRTKAM